MTPNWQQSYPGFPDIPEPKRWTTGLKMTSEQQIIQKLLNHTPLSKEEGDVLQELEAFYANLERSLRKMSYASLGAEQVELFKGYINYAFNYRAVITNELSIVSTYRTVVNEHVIQKNERIHHQKFLSYPSLEVVRRVGKLNRANTANTNLFYSADSIDTTLKEIRPPLGKLVTVGMWVPRDNPSTFTSYPISHGSEAIRQNEGVAKAHAAFENRSRSSAPQLMIFLRRYFHLLGTEFSKKVTHPSEYLVSSMLAEGILKMHEEQKDPMFRFECIVYPSVAHELRTDNLAMLPSVVDQRLRLQRVLEFEIEEANYDSRNQAAHPDVISLAKIKNLSWTSVIQADGQIVWP